MAIVSPSILSADFANLKEEVLKVKNAGASFLHVDVMDGHFVPNISLGAVVLDSIKDIDIIFDVHLMISDPIKYAESFKKAGANYITYHFEAVDNQMKAIDYIKSLGVKVGVSIKPNTDVCALKDYLKYLDLVLVMSVEPGFGGQKFMHESLEKIEWLQEQRQKNKYKYLIEVDGGINADTAKLCVSSGADCLVAGTYIFKSQDINQTIKGLLEL